MKRTKKLIIVGATAVVVVAGGLVGIPMLANAGSNDVTVSASAVRMGDLTNYISVTGTVESTDSAFIYAELSETVTAVHVKLGDVVQEGQLLCELDPADIENSIAEQKSTMSHSQQQSYNQIKEAERAYGDAQSNLRNATNSQINNAENAVSNAETELASRQKDYDEKLAEFSERTASQLQTAARGITDAQRERDSRKQAHDENQELFAVGAISQAELDTSQKELDMAQEDYNDAVKAYADAEKTLADELEAAKDALTNAQTTYDNAIASLKTTNTTVQQDLVKLQSNIESARLSANNDSHVFQLTKLERELAQTQIKATKAGTVTAVYAKAGVAANGLLFVIENTDSLKVETSIKEYNLSKLTPGMPAKIESDATGDALYDGALSLIAPASKKDSTGSSIVSADVDFEAEISIAPDSDLKIGSSARVDVIYEQRERVMHVPIEAVVSEPDGTSYLYMLTPQKSAGAVEVDESVMRAEGEESAPADSSNEGGRPARTEGAGGGRPARAEGEGGQRWEMPAMRIDPNAVYNVSRIEVTTGMETDLYMEVSGEGLRPGMLVASNPALVNEGDSVKIGLNNSGFGGGGGNTGGTSGNRGFGGPPMMRIGG